MCKRVGLMNVIQNGLFKGYDLYFQNRGKDPNSVTVLLKFLPGQNEYRALDPVYGTWRYISPETYQILVYGERKKFPGRKTK